ncbi:hypothetical protein SAMN05421640_2405 [Ekhidna lutea]|uniref:Uncharacterized protein n=1 Tax=Ekhidna lutea TaxID=447679 RepID=A0A239K5E8_EKHLU|nr:hypothetical protein [Ekhidna lutea]SNT12839.1 hypothetical protein SAMN05421640_2405 [Ekhidna lutea]
MKFAFGFTFLLWTLSSPSQDIAFQSIISEIQSNLHEVQTKNENYTHELSFVNHSVLRYTLTEIDKRGQSTVLVSEFNVADLDPYALREETRQDIIHLNLTVENSQRFIKKYENGEVDGYESNLLIVAQDIDNARTIKELIKQAIPLAKEIMDNKLKANTYEEMEDWLVAHVVKVEGDKKSYNQQLTALEDFPANFQFTQTQITSKSSEQKTYIFNLSDINIHSLRFNISGSSFSLNFETNRNQKLMRVLENEIPRGFDNKIEIFTNNVEEARDLKIMLTKAVPLAESKVESSIKKLESLQSAFDFLETYVKDIYFGAESIEQQIEGNCLIKYSLSESDTKSTNKTSAALNLIDINPTTIDYDISSHRMYVEFSTKESMDLIQTYENDAFDRYDDELKIYAENIEVARRIKAALQDLTRLCQRDYQSPFEGMTLEQKINWLTKNMEDVVIDDETFTQTFEQVDKSDPEKIKLTKLEINEKGRTEEIYEFNLTDLNPKSIQFDIGYKTLAVDFETKFKEDIIKYYKDGKIENYQDDFELIFVDVEKARNIILVFNQIIAELNE